MNKHIDFDGLDGILGGVPGGDSMHEQTTTVTPKSLLTTLPLFELPPDVPIAATERRRATPTRGMGDDAIPTPPVMRGAMLAPSSAAPVAPASSKTTLPMPRKRHLVLVGSALVLGVIAGWAITLRDAPASGVTAPAIAANTSSASGAPAAGATTQNGASANSLSGMNASGASAAAAAGAPAGPLVDESGQGNVIDANAPLFPALFAFNEAAVGILKPESLAAILKDLALCERVLVVGHTCSLGPESANVLNGLARATAVREVLVRAGVTAPIDVVSAGSNAPRASNGTQNGRRANRRVTVTCQASTKEEQ